MAADKEIAELKAQVALLSAQLAALTSPREPETLIPENYRQWAALDATAKTQLVADRDYGPDKGPNRFQVQLVFNEKKDQSGKRERPYSCYPRVLLHAHSTHEAEAYYRELCGITAAGDATSYQIKRMTGQDKPAKPSKTAR